MSCFLSGKSAEADEWLAQAEKINRQFAGHEPLAFLRQLKAGIAYLKGNYAQAEALMQEALQTFREMGPHTLQWYLAPLAVFQLAQGKHQEALECIGEVESLIETSPPGDMASLDALSMLAICAIMLNDPARAARYHQRLLPASGLCINFLIDRLLGQLEILLGQPEEAGRHIEAALAWACQEDFKIEIVFGLAMKAELVLLNVEPEATKNQTAVALLQEAQTLANQLGMAGEAAKLQGRLYTLVPTPPSSKDVKRAQNHLLQDQTQPVTPSSSLASSSGFPVNLSERELEVLRLVAAGKSNREIATELFLSIKTVGNHVSSILSKTGTANRAGATAFALRTAWFEVFDSLNVTAGG